MQALAFTAGFPFWYFLAAWLRVGTDRLVPSNAGFFSDVACVASAEWLNSCLPLPLNWVIPVAVLMESLALVEVPDPQQSSHCSKCCPGFHFEKPSPA